MEWETNDEILIALANRFKKIRKCKSISQEKLSQMSNVSYGSIKRFETTGEISLHSLLKLCVSLDMKNEIKKLFSEPNFSSIEEVLRYGR